MRNLLLLFFVIVGLSGFLLIWDSSPREFLLSEALSPQELPESDSYMKLTDSVQFTDTGEIAYQLTTEESRFFREKGYWQADNPYLIAYSTDNKNKPWELKADKGKILIQGREITLRKNVVGWQYSGVDEKNELRTSELRFYPKQQLAKTEQPLTLSFPRGITSATGMVANFSTEVYTLLADVKGEYRAP